MSNTSLKSIVDDIISIFPLFKEKIFTDDKGKFVIRPSNSQFAIMNGFE